MTSKQANEIDLNTETNLEILRELVKYWQNLTINAINELQKHKPTFTLDDLRNSDEENSFTK